MYHAALFSKCLENKNNDLQSQQWQKERIHVYLEKASHILYYNRYLFPNSKELHTPPEI